MGVPCAALGMATLAAKLLNDQSQQLTDVKDMLHTPVDEKELDMMRMFGLENGDGEVDKAEFVILCMVRMGAANPQIINIMTKRYDELDTSGDGSVSYEELMGRPDDSANVGEV